MHDLDDIIHRAKAAGWRVEVAGSGHYQFKSPDGEGLVTVSRTPSDYRALLNIESDLRRAGLDLTDTDEQIMRTSQNIERLRKLRAELEWHQSIIADHKERVRQLRKQAGELRSTK